MFEGPEFTILVVHAEQLHDAAVWRSLLPFARASAASGIRLTFFVNPYRAVAIGADIEPRVRELAGLGHEIAQHTHFYAGTSFLTADKADDLSDANVEACTRRDFAALQSMGAEPRGFTAGAWFLTDTALEVLSQLGFAYDCSLRHPRERTGSVNRHHRWLDSPRVYRGGGTEIVCLPTTCSVGRWFKGGWRRRIEGATTYQLVFLHDYDLLVSKTRQLLRLFLLLRRRAMNIDAGELSSYFVKAPVLR